MASGLLYISHRPTKRDSPGETSMSSVKRQRREEAVEILTFAASNLAALYLAQQISQDDYERDLGRLVRRANRLGIDLPSLADAVCIA